MSVTTQMTSCTYQHAAGNFYSIPFQYQDVTDIKAFYIQDNERVYLSYGSDYRLVAGLVDNMIEVLKDIPEGVSLTFYRKTKIEQQTILPKQSITKAIEKALDRNTLCIQEVNNKTEELTGELNKTSENLKTLVAQAISHVENIEVNVTTIADNIATSEAEVAVKTALVESHATQIEAMLNEAEIYAQNANAAALNATAAQNATVQKAEEAAVSALQAANALAATEAGSTQATQSAQNAQIAAQNAGQAKIDAIAAAQSAQQSMTTASNAANSATFSATEANISKEQAAEYATLAQNAASEADVNLHNTSPTAHEDIRQLIENQTSYTHPNFVPKATGIYKISVNNEGHVDSATPVVKSDIVSLGVPAQDTTYNVFRGATPGTNGAQGLVPAPNKAQVGLFLRGDGAWGTAVTPEQLEQSEQKFAWDYWHRLGDNYVPANTSNQGWNSNGVFMCSYNADVLPNQPSQWGQLINIPTTLSTGAAQIWIDQTNGQISTRIGNNNTVVHNQPFKKMLTTQEAFNSGSGYVRFSTGVQICYGNCYVGVVNGNSGASNTINFPLAFANTNYSITCMSTSRGATSYASSEHSVDQKYTAYFTTWTYNTSSAKSEALSFDYMAIGFWK